MLAPSFFRLGNTYADSPVRERRDLGSASFYTLVSSTYGTGQLPEPLRRATAGKWVGRRRTPNGGSNAYRFFAFLIAAHRFRCAAAMRALPAADIV